jgi:hypothetical protein
MLSTGFTTAFSLLCVVRCALLLGYVHAYFRVWQAGMCLLLVWFSCLHAATAIDPTSTFA